MIEIVDYLITTELLEKLGNEIIIGIEGEKIVNSRDFYSVFKTEENLKVIHAGNTIGEIPFSPQIREDENILLAARIWKIQLVDFKAHKIIVIKAQDGKKPRFFGTGGIVHPQIRIKMLEILKSGMSYEILDEPSQDEINQLRNDFSVFDIRDILHDRPVIVKQKVNQELEFYSFTGTKINRTIELFLNMNDVKCEMDEKSSSFLVHTSKARLDTIFQNLNLEKVNSYISELLENKPAILDFSKWGNLLPKQYQMLLVRNKYYDIDNTIAFLNHIQLIQIENIKL